MNHSKMSRRRADRAHGMPAAGRRLVASLAVVAVLACNGSGERRPHLILITADALRADHLSYTGYTRPTSPHLDSLAAEALVFSEAVTLVPKTGPSFASHFTGLQPTTHGVTGNMMALPAEIPVLAERLRQAGYATTAFVSNPILSPRKGFDRGFDHYEQFPRDDGLVELVTAFEAWGEATSWSQPSFVWIHFIDPHGPYTPPPVLRELFVGDELFDSDDRLIPVDYDPPVPGRRNRVLGAVPAYQRQGDEGRVAWYVSQYDAEIRHMDDAFGRLTALLHRRGLYDAAGILFTADHGESLGEHDYYFEHGWFVYDATLRVPLLVKPPGPGRHQQHDEQVSNLDTLPTLLAMAGLPIPSELPGRSLLGALSERPVLAKNPSTYSPRFLALRTPDHKWILQLTNGGEEIYDLVADPGETQNRLSFEPELAARLRAEAKRQEAAIRAPARGAPRVVEPGGDEAEFLRALGYAE